MRYPQKKPIKIRRIVFGFDLISSFIDARVYLYVSRCFGVCRVWFTGCGDRVNGHVRIRRDGRRGERVATNRELPMYIHWQRGRTDDVARS